MSTIFKQLTQTKLNKLTFEECQRVMQMVKNTGIVNNVVWGAELDDSKPDQVREWCESLHTDYDANLSGPDMVIEVRKRKGSRKRKASTANKKLTVADIKLQCKARGVVIKGLKKKAELEAALAAALAENEPEPESESEAEAEPEAEPEAESENEPEPESESEPEAEPEAEAESENEPEPETEPEAESENEPEPEDEDEMSDAGVEWPDDDTDNDEPPHE